MIYAIQDNKKIPLGTQFDNSWQIEYDRDLSSQIVGKNEWTATEDCWFQYHSIWIRQGDSYTNDNAYLTGVQITLNGVNVANMDKSNITNGTTGAIYMITSQLLMKKGDTVRFLSTASTGSQPAFNTTTTHVFPIHRILSKDDGPKIWNLSSDMSVAKELRITLNTKNYAPIFVSTHSDAAGYISTQPAPCVVFVSYANEIKTIPENVRTSFTVKNNNVLTLGLPRDAEYPTWQKRVSVSEVIPGTIKSVEIVEV